MALTLVDRDMPTLPAHVRASDDPAGFAAILMPDINLAIWSRDDAPETPESDALAVIDDIGITCAAIEVEAQMQAAMEAAGYSRRFVAPIARDVAMLASRMADVMNRDRVAIRLEVVETDACRKFHADYISARLICTYVGSGTQWIGHADAARLKAGAGIDTLDIRALLPGQVALFKGREWAPDSAIVHRSPPIAGTGERRLVLVIDPAPHAEILMEA